MSTIVGRIYKIFTEAIFPPKCLVCRRFLSHSEDDDIGVLEEADWGSILHSQVEKLLSGFLCRDCIAGLTTVESPLCSCCGVPFESRHGVDHRCGECHTSPKHFRIARAPLVFEQVFAEVIHCFKYKGKIQLARPLAELLLMAFGYFWDKDSIDLVIPVPLHLKRLRKRGFNQAHLLIRNWKAVSEHVHFDVGDLQIENDILIRRVPTASQSGLGRKQRSSNIKDAFGLLDAAKINDKRILLVEDVYTTGATVDDCARVLRHHGAAQVDVLSLARAV